MCFSVDGLVRLDRLGSARDSEKSREADIRDSDKPRKPTLREV